MMRTVMKSCKMLSRTSSSCEFPLEQLSYLKKPHIPVLKEHVIQYFNPKPGQIFIDMTFGGGGHTEALLQRCSNIQVYVLDRDVKALKHCTHLQNKYGKDTIYSFHGKFTDILDLLAEKNISTCNLADGILFDVGASSMQLDDRRRGFGLSRKGPLDMRMDSNSDDITAADVVNKLDDRDLQNILKKYGQEKRAKDIARAIVESRQMLGPIQTTRDLQDIVRMVYGDENQKDKLGRNQHPATLTFMALRTFVNDEYNQLYNGLKIAHRLLKPNGKCAAITFHSLEHRIVHQSFNATDVIHKETFITADLNKRLGYWLSDNKFIGAADDEINTNPRSRSAQLRVARKRTVF